MSENALDQLEKRVARLEDELREVKRTLSKEKAQPWWERTAGMFEGSKAFAEIVRLGRKIRRQDRDFDHNVKRFEKSQGTPIKFEREEGLGAMDFGH